MNTEYVLALKRQLTRECAKAAAAGQYPAVVRAQVDAGEGYDPLSWLASQKEYPKFFWRSEDAGRVLAYAGAAHIFTCSDRSSVAQSWATLRQWMTEHSSLCCWNGSSFYPGIKGPEWSDFDAWTMVVPRIGLERNPVNARWHLVCQLVLSGKEDKALESALLALDRSFYIEDISEFSPDIVSLEESPSYEGWQEMVKKVLENIELGVMSKVVLSRRLHLTLNGFVAPEAVMAQLLRQNGHAFLCLPAPQTGFLGVSPELLYHRRRDRLDTFAIAGTRPRGQDVLEDRQFKEELAASSKDRLEHKQVVDMLLDRLKSLCVLSKTDGKGGIIELSNQRHFFQRLRGRMLEGVTDEVIINTLHPTPAVGGVPTDKALDFLSSVEPFDRGWFAGTVGWLTRDEAQMAVGIRSALVRQAEWYIYAGAGVVSGSNALAEWEETALKMKNIMDIIYER